MIDKSGKPKSYMPDWLTKALAGDIPVVFGAIPESREVSFWANRRMFLFRLWFLFSLAVILKSAYKMTATRFQLLGATLLAWFEGSTPVGLLPPLPAKIDSAQ